MKKLSVFIGIVLVDFILIWLWVKDIDPDPSMSIGIILVVPFVFVLNLVIAGALYLIKKRDYVQPFLVNSIVASIIMYYLFGQGIYRDQRERLESWEFVKADTTYQVIRWKKENAFSMSYSTDPGSSTEFLHGKAETKDSFYILTSDSTKYLIKDNYLIGFRAVTDTIQLEKVER